MNIFKLLTDIEKVDGEVFERLTHISRRNMFGTVSKKAMAFAVPALIATSLNKAYATTPGAIDILNFALTLEYLENEFYVKAIIRLVLFQQLTRLYLTKLVSMKHNMLPFY